MEYISVTEARGMTGLRLVLSVGTPGPWGIAARALFDIRGVSFVPVRQDLMQANEELVAWTGRRNAPVAVFEEEPAVDGWLEIAVLAERLGSGPPLFPDDPVERALAVGFSAEICGHGGFGWSRRLTMASGAPAGAAPPSEVFRGYGLREGGVPEAGPRVIGILHGLSMQLHKQRQAGSDYLVGERLSLCDVHWACFSQLIAPLSPADCAIPDHMRTMFASMPPEMQAAVDPILIEHRDRIWQRYIGLPLVY